MTRPSRNTDRLLLDAAKKMIPRYGFSHLKIRDVAKKAGVNLGMFNYHFKTKDKFIQILLKEMYAEFFSKLKLESESGVPTHEKMERIGLTLAKFILDNRDLLFPLIQEIVMGNKKMMEFALKNMTAHVSIIFRLIMECQKEKSMMEMPVLNAVPILMGAVALPSIVIKILESFVENKLITASVLKTVEGIILSDKGLEQRISIVWKGLSSK